VAYTQVLKVVKKPLSSACTPVHRNIGHSRLIGRLFFYIGSDISDRQIGFFLVSAHPYLKWFLSSSTKEINACITPVRVDSLSSLPYLNQNKRISDEQVFNGL
jgi:hypothetical protein